MHAEPQWLRLAHPPSPATPASKHRKPTHATSLPESHYQTCSPSFVFSFPFDQAKYHRNESSPTPTRSTSDNSSQKDYNPSQSTDASGRRLSAILRASLWMRAVTTYFPTFRHIRNIKLESHVGIRETISTRISMDNSKTSPPPAIVKQQVQQLWKQNQSQCAWFMRGDFVPETKDDLLRCLQKLALNGDRTTYVKARKLIKCL